MEAYFDNSATTPVYPEVRDLVVKLMGSYLKLCHSNIYILLGLVSAI